MNISEHQDAIGSRSTPEITPQMMESRSLNTNDKHQPSTESPPESAPQMIAPLSFGSLLSFALDNPATGSHPLLPQSSIGDTLPPKSIGDMLSRNFSFVSTGSKSELLKENDSFRICEDNPVNKQDFSDDDEVDSVWERGLDLSNQIPSTNTTLPDDVDPNQEQGPADVPLGSTSELLKGTGSHPLLPPSSIGDTLPPKSIGDMLSRNFSLLSTGSTIELLEEKDSFGICEDTAVNTEDFLVGDDVGELDFASFCDHLDPNQEQGSVSTTSNRVSPGKRPPDVPLLEPERAKKRKWTEAENKRLEEGVKIYGEGNWSPIATHVGGKRDNRACRQKWVLNLRPEIKVGNKTGAWSKEEDEQLRQILSGLDCKDPRTWELASKAMGYSRNIKQIKSRYDNFLDPTLKHGPWTKEEDDNLLSLQRDYGNKWKKFQLILVGRSSDHIRRRFIRLSKHRSKNTEFRLWRRV